MRLLRTVYGGGAKRWHDLNREHDVTRLHPEVTRLGHDRDLLLFLLFEHRNLGLRRCMALMAGFMRAAGIFIDFIDFMARISLD